MKTDPTILEILHNYFNAISSGMSYVLERTSYSSYVTESSDFGTALATVNGDFFAYPKNSGVAIFLGLSIKKAIEACGGTEAFQPGDIIITNDPYATDGLSTHLPDVHVIKPIFCAEKLLCYAWSFVHTVDIGGCIPSSLSPAATDVQMEGLRIPPVWLYRQGVLNKDIVSFIRACSRMPDQLLGDINSMVASVNTAESKMRELATKFGLSVIQNGIMDLLEQSELRTRKIFSQIPDGQYTFEDYVDNDAISDVPLRIAVSMNVNGSDIILDFSRCDPQVPTAYNLITNGTCHTYLCNALINYVISEDPYIPLTGSISNPIRVILPTGTIVNAEYPAACGLRHPVSLRIYTAVLGALANIIPKKIPAAGGGQAAIIVISVPDQYHNGEYKSNVVEPMSGGGGGQFYLDGVEGVDQAVGYLSNTPIEILENKTDILVNSYELLPDTAGAGLYRGGNAIGLSFKIIRDNSLVMARGQERMRFQPYGLQGGRAGKTGNVVLNPGTKKEHQLSKINVLHLNRGDVISFQSPSGGGWGDPWKRPVDVVLSDVVNELLSPASAKENYGVIVKNDGKYGYYVDDMQTHIIRKKHVADNSEYDFGNIRKIYESFWTPEVSNVLAEQLQKIPSFLRSDYKVKVHHILDVKKENITAQDIKNVFAEITMQEILY